MGRETRNFRQSRKSNFASSQASAYSRVSRQGGWGRIFNAFKLKKGEIK